MTHAVQLVWLTLLWVLLWRRLTIPNVVSGLLVALAVARVLPAGTNRPSQHRLHLPGLVVFAGYFAWKLVEANLVLAREVVTRKDDLRRGIVAIPVTSSSDLVTTLVASAITLTPGTLTLEVRRDPRTLYVHVLHMRDVDAVRADARRFEELAMRAFPLKNAATEPAR